MNFLDTTLNRNNKTYTPYTKPKSSTKYIHNKSNHPLSIISNLPLSVNKRLSSISSNEKIFTQSTYNHQNFLFKWLSPVESPQFLETSQQSRQLLPYLQDIVGECLQNGRSRSQAVGLARSCCGQRGSWVPKRENDFCEGGAVGEVNLLTVRCPTHVLRPGCSAFWYAAVVKTGRFSYENCNLSSKC